MDQAHLAQLLMRHRTALYAYVLANVRNHADAEDILQNVSVAVVEAFEQLRDEAGFLPWAIEISRRRILKHRRVAGREQALDPELVSRLAEAAGRVEQTMPTPVHQTALRACLDGLPATSRRLMEERYDGSVRDVAELASRVGRSVQSVYAQIKRIKTALRECVERRLTAEALMIDADDRDRLQAYLDGELSAEETAMLDDRLKREPALADALVRLAREEAILTEWARVGAKTGELASLAANRGAAVIRFPTRRWWPAAVAALLLVALGVSYWSRTSSPPRSPIAKLQHVTGDVRRIPDDGRFLGAVEFALYSGQGVKVVGEESYAVVVYADGTRLELDGDATIAELSGGEKTGKRVVLAEGNLRADVAKQPAGRPMTLVTPSAEVVVLGTKFGLSSGSAATYVETQEGAVRLTRTGDGRSVEVPAGFEVLAEAATAVFAALPSPPRFQRSRFAGPGYYRTTALSPDGRTLVTSRFPGGEVELWDAAAGTKRHALSADPAQVVATAFSGDGRKLATAGEGGSIKVWNTVTGNSIATLAGPPQVQALALSNDGGTVTALSGPPQGEKTLTTWDVASGDTRMDPPSFTGEAWTLSADGQRLAIGKSRRGELIVWNVAAGRREAVLGPFTNRLLCLAFSPDGSRLAVSDHDGRVTLWNVAEQRLLSTIRPAGQTVHGLAYSPDGSLLAMGQRRATVRLWDVSAAKQVAVLEGPVNPGSTATVRPMFFSPDGRTLATTESHDAGTVRLWDLPLK